MSGSRNFQIGLKKAFEMRLLRLFVSWAIIVVTKNGFRPSIEDDHQDRDFEYCSYRHR